MIREDFLQQNAFVDTDAYSSYDKQFKLMRLILSYYELSKKALAAGADMNAVFSIPARDKVGRAKHCLLYTSNPSSFRTSTDSGEISPNG